MRLQDVIKEREAEISALEATVREKNRAEANGTLTQSSQSKRDNSQANGDALIHLSPKTMTHFSEIRKSLDLHHANHYTVSDVDESLQRLNELMR